MATLAWDTVIRNHRRTRGPENPVRGREGTLSP